MMAKARTAFRLKDVPKSEQDEVKRLEGEVREAGIRVITLEQSRDGNWDVYWHSTDAADTSLHHAYGPTATEAIRLVVVSST